MFPAPGNKVTDAWIGLAKELSEKNFSVLLFDWRGCGMNAADTAGHRILADKNLFWQETYNQRLLKPQRAYEDKGLDYRARHREEPGADAVPGLPAQRPAGRPVLPGQEERQREVQHRTGSGS